MPLHQGQIAGARWDVHLYLRFSDHRLRPAVELVNRVPLESPRVICDLGCGAGHVTRLIAERWPSATVYGIDHSKEMLAQATAEPGRIRWIEADIRTWSPDETPDLIYSNAALHWVEAHHELFPRLLGVLKANGCLAVQMPLSWELPSHRLMRKTLENGGPGGSSLGTEALRRVVNLKSVGNVETYYELLADRTRHLDIWETEYLQVLEGDHPVLEWVKGTALRPILNALGERERELFLAEYARRLSAAYPARPDGRTLYPFRRLFMVATR
jgi:trans-aconitate 2-methyltransferase